MQLAADLRWAVSDARSNQCSTFGYIWVLWARRYGETSENLRRRQGEVSVVGSTEVLPAFFRGRVCRGIDEENDDCWKQEVVAWTLLRRVAWF